MPSDKRARQRAMRQVKVTQIQKRKRRLRWLRRAAGALIAVAALVGVIALVSQHSKQTGPPVNKAIAPVCLPNGKFLAAYRHTRFTDAPPMCISERATYDATVKTDVGTFVIAMPAAASPQAVDNFVFLAGYRFYDGTRFFRVDRGFVIQGGDPENNGSGGPGYSWVGNTPPATCTAAGDCYPTWSVAYADTGSPTSNGSQFFIIVPGGAKKLGLDYTRFGTVVKGRAVVARIVKDGSSNPYAPTHVHQIISVTITKVAA